MLIHHETQGYAASLQWIAVDQQVPGLHLGICTATLKFQCESVSAHPQKHQTNLSFFARSSRYFLQYSTTLAHSCPSMYIPFWTSFIAYPSLVSHLLVHSSEIF